MRSDNTRAVVPINCQLACSRAKESLSTATSTTSFRWLEPRSTRWVGCTNPGRCEEFRQILYEEIWGPTCVTSALNPWQPRWSDNLCLACNEIAQPIHQSGRTQLWNELPSHFDEESWDVLKQWQYDSVRDIFLPVFPALVVLKLRSRYARP